MRPSLLVVPVTSPVAVFTAAASPPDAIPHINTMAAVRTRAFRTAGSIPTVASLYITAGLAPSEST